MYTYDTKTYRNSISDLVNDLFRDVEGDYMAHCDEGKDGLHFVAQVPNKRRISVRVNRVTGQCNVDLTVVHMPTTGGNYTSTADDLAEHTINLIKGNETVQYIARRLRSTEQYDDGDGWVEVDPAISLSTTTGTF